VTGDRSQQDGPGSPPGGGGPAPDILEQSGRRFPSLNWSLKWRPPRSAAILLAVGLVAGLVVGYAAGVRQVPKSAGPPPPATVSPSPVPPSPAPLLAAGGQVLTQTTSSCSAQVGRQLQLGVEVTNQSAADVTLGLVHPVLPLGGLKAVAQQWAPCGGLGEAGRDPDLLTPGASTWFSVTFQVLVGCPGPLPVQFTVDYIFEGQLGTASLPGFPDLGQVPYADCPTAGS
jgi:hypothetical protein